MNQIKSFTQQQALWSDARPATHKHTIIKHKKLILNKSYAKRCRHNSTKKFFHLNARVNFEEEEFTRFIVKDEFNCSSTNISHLTMGGGEREENIWKTLLKSTQESSTRSFFRLATCRVPRESKQYFWQFIYIYIYIESMKRIVKPFFFQKQKTFKIGIFSIR